MWRGWSRGGVRSEVSKKRGGGGGGVKDPRPSSTPGPPTFVFPWRAGSQ